MARFVLDGNLDVRFLASLPTDPNAPTQAELTAGVSLVGTKQTEELVEINGYELQTSTIPTPGMAGLATGNVGGEQTYPDSSIMVYKDDTSELIYASQTQGTTGFYYLSLDGLGSGEESEGFPVTVLSRPRAKAAKTGHKFTVNTSVDVPYDATQAA